MNLLIYGIKGYMGKIIERLAIEDGSFEKVHGISSNFSSMDETINYDLMIDFSHNSAFDKALDLAVENKIPFVSGTTGLDDDQFKRIEIASKSIPVLYGSNMSLGMNLMFKLVEEVANSLKDTVDIEVIEAHHNRKKDAPSGSAKSIVQAIEKGLGDEKKKVYGRVDHSPREKGEIGVHAIRGGNIAGFHEAMFINELESIKISHEAYNREVFAKGAIYAGKFIIGKECGLYNMNDVLNI